jgi:hypothetical protein
MSNLLREYIKEIFGIVSEGVSGERGILFENALVADLKRSGKFIIGESAGNDSSISDLDIIVDPGGAKIGVAFEVKLSFNDLLGKVRKKHFKSLIWDGDKFVGIPIEGGPIVDTVQSILGAMNASELAKKKMQDLEDFITRFKPLPWDLMSTFGNDSGNPNERLLYAVMRNEKPKPNEPARFPLPRGVKGVPSKQITTGSEIAITPEDIRKIISGKNGSMQHKTYYIIVGSGTPAPVGQIFSLGIGDPLKLNAPLFDPGKVGVEMRFQGSGGESGPGRRFSFGLDTRGAGEHNEGVAFGGKNGTLADILLSGLKISSSRLKKQIKKQIKANQKF